MSDSIARSSSGCDVSSKDYLLSNNGDLDSGRLVCAIGVFRHADRTCKEKVSLKFNGDPPSSFKLNEEFRAPDLFHDLALLVETLKCECKSEESVFLIALRLLKSGKEDLKVKLESLGNIGGWVIKLKWGGNLTPLGIDQSREAGSNFSKNMSLPCNLKVYSSTDTRCKETASSFVFGMLGREDVSIRADDGPDGLGSLDESGFSHSPMVQSIRTEVAHILMSGKRITNAFIETLFPEHSEASPGVIALREIGTTYGSFACAVIQLGELVDSLVDELTPTDDSKMYSRWQSIYKSIHRQPGNTALHTQSGVLFSTLQISQIGVIFDNSQYDFQHTIQHLVGHLVGQLVGQIFSLSQLLTRVVFPCEYGLTLADKYHIGSTFLEPLVRKIRFDIRLSLGIPLGDEIVHMEKHNETTSPDLRIRLYFGHHSHMMSFVSVLASGHSDLGYLSAIIFKIYLLNKKWRLEIALSSSTGEPFVSVLNTIVDTPERIDDFLTSMLPTPISHDSSFFLPSTEETQV